VLSHFKKLLKIDHFLDMHGEKEDEHEAENEDAHRPTDQYDAQTNVENASDDTHDHEGTPSPNAAINSVGGPTILPVGVSSQAPLPSNQLPLPMYKKDLYRFPWFRGFLGLMALMLTTLYVFLLAISATSAKLFGAGSESTSYHIFFLDSQYWVPVTFGAPICYTVLFVVLEDFQTPLATFLEQRLKIPRQHQRRIMIGLPVLFGAIIAGLQIFLLVYIFVPFFLWCIDNM
jgi:hypothetical protein